MRMFDQLSNAEVFYLGCALVGGGLFALRSLMMLIGMGGDHDGVDGADLHAPDSDGSPVQDFKMVSVHSLTAFLLMFGLVGFLLLRNQEAAPWIAGSAGFAVGIVTMFIIAKLFYSSRKLQSDGTIYPANAVGVEGSVYLAIRPGEIGKVQLTVRGALKIFDARANDHAAAFKTGDPVKVVSAGDVLIVERA
jgi:hypothetical protein